MQIAVNVREIETFLSNFTFLGIFVLEFVGFDPFVIGLLYDSCCRKKIL